MAWTSSAHAHEQKALDRARKRRSQTPAGTHVVVEHDEHKDPYRYRVVEYAPGEPVPELGPRVTGVTVLACAPSFAIVEAPRRRARERAREAA